MSGFQPVYEKAVSVIVPISSITYAVNVFTNYIRQSIEKKELILVHSNASDDFEQWLHLSRLYPLTRVYRLNNGTALGECLNYCADRAIFENIAIFREMHCYEREYLAASFREMVRNSAELAGKKTYVSICDRDGSPTIFNPGYERCLTDSVILPTFLYRQALHKSIRFTGSDEGLDERFCEECRNKGYRVYSTGSDGFQFHR